MKPSWILVAGKAGAKIFELRRKNITPQELFEIDNTSGRLKEQELASDRPGRATHFKHTQRNPLPREHSKKERLLDKFIATLAKQLVKFERDGRFKDLVLVAEPHFLGKLRVVLASHKSLKIVAEIEKDLLKIPGKELGVKLNKYLQRETINPIGNLG